jgi:hypothetical protein
VFAIITHIPSLDKILSNLELLSVVLAASPLLRQHFSVMS